MTTTRKIMVALTAEQRKQAKENLARVFPEGLRVKLTRRGREQNLLPRSKNFKGVVVGYGYSYPVPGVLEREWPLVRVRPDGYKSVHSYHPDFWEPVETFEEKLDRWVREACDRWVREACERLGLPLPEEVNADLSPG